MADIFAIQPLPTEGGVRKAASPLYPKGHCISEHAIVSKLVFVEFHNAEGVDLLKTHRFFNCRFFKFLITNRVWVWHGFD